MATELEQALAISPELHAGGGGIFDVLVDGELIFSKHQLQRFPDEGEITSLINKIP